MNKKLILSILTSTLLLDCMFAETLAPITVTTATKTPRQIDGITASVIVISKEDIEKTSAFYTACIAIVYENEVYTVHGWMYGSVINTEIGEGGFGYDPLFIPKGLDKTLGELSHEVKKEFSHRSKALSLAKKVLDVII